MWTDSAVLTSVKLLNKKAGCLLVGAANFTLQYSSVTPLGIAAACLGGFGLFSVNIT
jgi:hypothetical protein